MVSEDELWTDFNAAMEYIEPKIEKHIETYNHYICKCGGNKIYTTGELPFCTSCGVVDSFYIDETPEWTNGVSESGESTDNSRAGYLAVDNDLYSNTWGVGTVINAKWNSSYATKRMARINFYQSMNSKDRRLFHSYSAIDRAASSELGLPDDVIKDAKVMYKKFSEDLDAFLDLRIPCRAPVNALHLHSARRGTLCTLLTFRCWQQIAQHHSLDKKAAQASK